MFYAEPTVVTILSDDLRGNYKTRRQRPHGEEWPPYQPSSIVNLALIHYKDRRTQQELIEIHECCKEGASYVDNLTATLSNVTTDIKKLFIPDAISNKSPKRILIEGAPGIGKTVLAKEIAYQWANGEILKENKLLFLLYLRDPEVHEVTSVNEIIELFTSENTPDLEKYVNKSRGINVAFVFDGFDEYPVALQKNSFITDFIKDVNHYNSKFCNSTVVVTSRPTATLFLHDVVDRRIEVLGFPKMEREKYVSKSLKDSVYKAQDLDMYLKQHPIINNLSYIPLHLVILIYLFQQDSLPETLTEMNESFIINTIYRYLERNKLSPPSVVKKLENLPTNIVEFIYKLSQLAFEGLQVSRLVFTLDEIRKTCPEVDNIPGAINGFGLLQAVQHYLKGGAGRITSVNFLHFTMQEYLAALHVSTLPSDRQSSLMRRTFWDGQFNFMWMMYVGIVGVKSKTFASFIASKHINSESYSDYRHYLVGKDSIYNDKRKCLHLFQCYIEAKSDAEMPKTISSIFTDGEIILDNITLYPHQISSLIFFMSSSSMQQWKMLKLGHCNLRDIGMNSLLEHVIKNDENISTLQYVDLSGNDSSPWGVYCVIIKHCSGNSLTLCGDEGMEKYVKEIADSLQANAKLQSLTLYKIGNTGVQTIGSVLDNNTTLRQLNISVKSEIRITTKVIHRKLMHNKSAALGSNSHERVVDINILYNGDYRCSSEVISVSKFNVSYDELSLIAFGLYSNTTVIKLDLSGNRITDDGVLLISDCLEYNNTLKELDLSCTYISMYGMTKLSKCIKHPILLEYVDLSGNRSSPWGVYCAIIKHCSGNSLTLCGDEGMKYYVKKITDSLQRNITLQSLTLCKIKILTMQLIKRILVNNRTLRELNLSWENNAKGTKIFIRQLKSNNRVNFNILCDVHIKYSSKSFILSKKNISDYAVYVITSAWHDCEYMNNTYTTVKKLDLSYNNITIEGMNRLSECAKYATSLEYVDLSGNKSSPWGVYCAVIRHCCVNSLTLCGDERMEEHIKEITVSLQINTTLQSLTFCRIGSIGICLIELIVLSNTTLKELNLSWNNGKGTKICTRQLKSYSNNSLQRVVDVNILCDVNHENSVKTTNLPNMNIDDDALYVIAFAGWYNDWYTLHYTTELDLSQNNITNKGMEFISECVKTYTMSKFVRYVDLSDNKSSPWGVYCTIIKQCCVDSLTLCGDEGMIEYIQDIGYSLNGNKTLQSLTLCKIKRITMQLIEQILVVDNTTLRELNLSWERNAKGTKKFIRSSNRVNINILCDVHNAECSFILSKKNFIGDDAVYIITSAGHNREYMSNTYTTLKKLDLSYNNITIEGMNRLSECAKYATSLEYVDLSGNKSSPWGVYCAVIRHCCVDSLTLCGDEGMEQFVENIMDGLQINTILRSLTLCASRNIEYHNKTTVKELVSDLSHGISPWDVYVYKQHCVNMYEDKGMKYCVENITDSQQRNVIFQSLTLCVSRRNVGRYKDMICKTNNTKRSQRILVIDGKIFCRTLINDDQITSLNNNNRVVINTKILLDHDAHSECSCESINLSNRGIDNDDAVCLIAFGLYNNTMIKELDLSYNNISMYGMNKLSECIKHPILLEYVDLSGNESSPWGVYCAIIRHCCVNSLTLCGDEGMKHYAKKIIDSLQINKTLQSLILRASRSIVSQESTLGINGKLFFDTLVGDTLSSERVVNIKVLYGSCGCLPGTISLSNKNINDDSICPIAFGLCNNTTVSKLDLSCNNISMSGMSRLSECVKYASLLQHVDLSGNDSSPWGVYCAIIKHCSGNSLTLCGDEGMKYYVKKITDSLQRNTTLQSLTLFKIGRNGQQFIKDILGNNTTLKEMNISWKSKGTKIIHRHLTHDKFNSTHFDSSGHEKVVDVNILYDGDLKHSSEVINMSNKGIDDDAVCLLMFGLYNNTTIKKLNLSYNNITDDGAAAIADCLKANNTLQELNLSKVRITNKGLKSVTEAIQVNKRLQKLDLSRNYISDDGMIIHCLKDNNTLRELNLSGTRINKEGLKLISETLHVSEHTTVATSVSKQARSSKDKKGGHGKETDVEELSTSLSVSFPAHELPVKEQSTATRKRNIAEVEDSCHTIPTKQKRGLPKRKAVPTQDAEPAKIVTAHCSRKRKAVHKTGFKRSKYQMSQMK